MNYEIIDNFLPKSSFNAIKNTIFNEEFPWLCKEIKADADSKLKKYINFDHIVYTQNVPVSPFFEELEILISRIDCKSLLNMSCNMHIGASEIIEKKIKPFYPFPNTQAILYLNNSDGYTIVEENIKIENIENRLLVFDGSKNYIETNCTNNTKKINIVFNYI